MAVQFSKAQQEAINIRNTNVIVSASAGSGKTAVLVERLCQLVLKDKISIDSILAMTFTNDAAAEMKARLLSKLKEQEPTEYIRQQMALLETASICTIDSFCLSIVQRFYYKIPISYTMSKTTASTAQSNLAFNQAYQKATSDMDVAAYTNLKRFFQAYGKQEEEIKTYVQSIINTLNSKSEEDAHAWIEKSKKAYETIDPDIQEYIMCYFKNHTKAMIEILELILSWIEDPTDLIEKKERLNNCLNCTDYASFKAHFILYLQTIGLKKKIGDIDIESQQKSFKDHESKIYTKLFDEDFYLQDLHEHRELVTTLIQLTNLVKDYYQKEKSKMEIIDFNDMEHFAYQLLQDPMIQEEICNQYNMILVDEFQDTNELQEKIIASFCRENNVFRVGDIKQSIYGFRQADPSIMKAWKEKKDVNNTPLLLQDNYRSNQSIITFNNDFYSKIMVNDMMGTQFEEEDYANVGTNAQSECAQFPIRFLYTEYKDEEGNKSSLKSMHNENRFDLIARDILSKHEQGIPYKDMCILTRSHAPQEKIKDCFESYNIPAFITIDHGFYSNAAVQIVTSTLSAIQDVHDDICLCACLMSSLCGVSFLDLAQSCLLKEKKQSLYSCVRDKDFMAPFFEIYKQKYRPIAELIRYIYSYNDFYYEHTTDQDKTNLDYLLEVACAYENQNDLNGFIEQLKNDSLQDTTQETSLYGKEDDVVQVKTMHQSKGLQFPIVYILSSHDSKDRTKSEPVLVDRFLGLSFNGLSKDYKLKYTSFYHLGFQTKKFLDELAEEMRILYVATTRPIKELVFVDTIESLEMYSTPINTYTLMENDNYTGWFLRTYLEKNVPFICFDKGQIYSRPEKVRKSDRKAALKKYSLPSTPFSSQTASQSKVKLVWPKIQLEKNIGTLRGTLFHEIVANCSFPYRKEACLAYAKKYGYELNDYDLEQILKLNYDPLYSSWMKEEHKFEQSYIVQEKKQVIHGFMDLVVYKENEIIIVDFKTDHVVKEEELIQKYKIQLDTYKNAMKKVKNCDIYTFIYSFYLNKCIELC